MAMNDNQLALYRAVSMLISGYLRDLGDDTTLAGALEVVQQCCDDWADGMRHNRRGPK